MVIGWICSRDLFETSWEGLHEVLPIFIAEESRMFTCVLSLPQWRCFRNFEPLMSHTNVHAGCGRSWRAFLERVWLRWFSVLWTYWGQVYWHNASLVNNVTTGRLNYKFSNRVCFFQTWSRVCPWMLTASTSSPGHVIPPVACGVSGSNLANHWGSVPVPCRPCVATTARSRAWQSNGRWTWRSAAQK